MVTGGKGEPKGRAFSQIGFHTDFPAECLDDGLADGKPQAGSLAEIIYFHETFEDRIDIFRGDADSGVYH